jgi:predicted nucleotidyltransferase component of viral defense system
VNATYPATARLLSEVAPITFESGLFALKGGTAINLFLRDMPRLSVDLDLVFTDHRIGRTDALHAINQALQVARRELVKRGLTVRAGSSADTGDTKLLVRRDGLVVKVEVNTVIRGTVAPPVTAALSPTAIDALMVDLELPLASTEDIYGGKLVAAMDRQHPRDLFDVMGLFAHGGITPAITRAFVVNEREFLRGLLRVAPDWSLLEIPHVEELPAVRWRLQNLQHLKETDAARLRGLATALDERFGAL